LGRSEKEGDDQGCTSTKEEKEKRREGGEQKKRREGGAIEGEAIEGEAIEGEAIEGEAIEGEAIEGEAKKRRERMKEQRRGVGPRTCNTKVEKGCSLCSFVLNKATFSQSQQTQKEEQGVAIEGEAKKRRERMKEQRRRMCGTTYMQYQSGEGMFVV
jgi:hypothetical protein